ncbi:MAG: hypothetical protein JO360_08365 [Acidobacteria bacterium]|nr:hypothetical protein [Acidobacteriota bacterium]
MSRTRKAGIIASFGYLQFALAFVSGILLVPFILRRVGTPTYGLWLACGDLLAHSAMVDLGVLSVLPWLIAEKDGRQDRAGMRELLNNALAVALLTSLLYSIVAFCIWKFASNLAQLGETQRETIVGPLLLVIAATALAFPLRTFSTVLMGLQDVVFTGCVNIGMWALNICLVVTLLLKGYGLYALAAASAFPPLISSTLCLIRVRMIAPDLLRGWGRPSPPQMFYLIKQGLGTWMGGFGWAMIAASDSLIILSVISPEQVVVYACTLKLGEILMQLAWQLSDSGLVGLAQLYGEGKLERVREVVLSMLRIKLIAAGGVVFILLAFNAVLVSFWVGVDKFGGYTLNALLAASVLALSLTNGLFAPAATLGSRLQIGVLTLMQGVLNVALAIPLGYLIGLPGIALASLCSSLFLSFPFGVRILNSSTQLSLAQLWKTTLLPWLLRIAGLLVLAAIVGFWLPPRAVILMMVIAPLLGALYVWHMRPLYVGLPVPLKVRPWLVRMRLLPQL